MRRGGGILVLTALAFFAGSSLPEFPVSGDAPKYPAEQCLRVVAVVRLATGRPELPGPFLLLQTAWTQDAHRTFDCEASDRVLPVPPVHNRVFVRRGAAFELLPAPDVERILDRLFEFSSEPKDRPVRPYSHPPSEAT